MSNEGVDPYAQNLVTGDNYASKVDVMSRLVVVLRGTLEERGLTLITSPTRAVRAGEVHELLVSDEFGIRPGSVVNRVSYIGFIEIENAGVLGVGDTVRVNGRDIGRLAGYDYTHMPNHMNIVLYADHMMCGESSGLKLNGLVSFSLQ